MLKGLRQRIDHALGLGPSDEPRPFAVEGPARARVRPVVSTPGARVRISRDGHDGTLTGLLLWCHRRGIPVELVDGPNGAWLDGEAETAQGVKDRLR
jgi:hypothetical protein